MYTRKFKDIAVTFLMVLSFFLIGGGNCLWAFSVDVKNISYSNPAPPPDIPRTIVYNFSTGSMVSHDIIIPDSFVLSRPATETGLTYYFGPYPVGVGETNDIAVALNTGAATLTTSTGGGCILNTSSPSTAQASNQWVYAVQLQNFAGMSDTAKKYAVQIGFGSPNPAPHPEFTAAWDGGNLILAPKIFNDAGNGTTVWQAPAPAVLTGLTPATAFVELRISLASGPTNFNMIFDYRLSPTGNWTTVATYSDILLPPPNPFPYPGFPALYPYVSLDSRTADGGGTGTHNASGTYTWNAANGVLTLNWTSSDFTCDGPELSTETKTGVTVTATTMPWADDGMTWTRTSGTTGDILGSWTSTDSETGNAYTLTFNANGNVSVTGVIVQCGGGGGMDPFQVFSSHEQNGYYAHVFVQDPGQLYSSVTAESAGLLSTTALVWNGSQWWLPQGTNLFLGTEMPTTFPSFHIVATKTAGGTQDILDRAITGYVLDSVTITSPGESVTAPPTFSWTWPAGAPVERFGVGVRDETANMHVMDTYDIQPSQRSIAYNGQPLISGHQYRYWIQANIGPNSSQVQGSFTYTGGGVQTISFSGVLKKYSDSSPVSGGVVEMAGNPSLSTTANADGSFALAGLPSGQPFTVKFTKPLSDPTNYVPSYSAVLQSMANFSSARAFNLYTQTELNNWSGATGRGLIRGRVMNSANTQAAYINGAVVTYNSTQSNTYRVKYENDQGLLVDGPGTFTNGKYYILDVAEGDTVTVFAAHPNYAFPSGRVFITHDGAVSQGSVYGNANPGWITIGGLIKTGDNTTGIGGATVEQVGVTPANAAISNSDGSFALTVPSGSAIYMKFSKPQAAAPLAPTYTAEMQFMTNVSSIFNLFSMTKLGTGTGNWNVTPGKGIIRARVKDQAGNNLSGATVTYASALNRTDYPICYDDACSSTLTATPADGRYIIKNVEPGDTLTVTAQKAGATFTQRVFHVYGDSVHQGGITALSTGPTPHPEAEAIQTRFGAAIAAYNAGDFTAAGFASFISESYLDGGENKNAFIAHAQEDRDPNVTLTWTNLTITGTGSDAILNLTWSDGENDTLYFRKEGDLWMFYGNQKLFDADVHSGHQIYPMTQQPYWVSLAVDDPAPALGVTITGVNVAGPGLPSGGINLYHDTMGQQWHSWGQGPSQVNLSPSFSVAPAVPLDYTFTISYTGGTSVSPDVQVRQVQSFVDAAPSPGTLFPASGTAVTDPLTFSWGSAGPGYSYAVELNDLSYNRLWEKRDITGISILYDGPALAPGQYSYTIVTRDAFGNSSFVTMPFNYGMTSPYYTVNVVQNNIRVIKGQQAEFVLNTQFFNNYSTAQGIGFTTDQPVLNAFFTPVPVRNSGGVVMKVDTTNLAAGAYQGSIRYGEVGSAFDKAVPFTLQVVTVTDIKFYDWQQDPVTLEYIKNYTSVFNVANQGQTNFWSANNEITLSDNSVMEYGPLEFTGNDPRFITIHKSSWGNDFFAEGPNGLSTVTAVAPDGTTKQLTFDINIPATPQVTSIGLSPAFVTNKYADTIAFSATGTESIGYGSRGMLDIKDDTRSWYDANKSVSGTFKLDLTNPPAPGKYLFTAFISGATYPAPEKVVPLIIVNDPSYSMIRGGVRLLDPSLPIHGVEGFTLEFYNSMGVKQFSREYWSYAHDGSAAGFEIGAIPPGTYKLKYVPGMYSIRPQWWPNADDINGAQAVEFAAGQVIDNIYFFAQSVPTISFSGSVRDVSITSPTTGNPIVGANVYVPEAYNAWATTDASGNFTLQGIPAGQPFTVNVTKDGYIPVYSGNFNFATNIGSPWPFALMTESEVSLWQVGGQNLWQSGKGMVTSRIVNGANPSETIGGAQISVTSSLGNTYNVTYFDGTAFGGSVTAPNGLFYIYGITPGDTVTVTAFKDGWAFNTNTYTVRYESIGEQLLFGTSGGTQSISFFGAVTDRNNNPIAAAQVEVVGSDPLLSTISDGMGNFVLSGIPLNQTFHLKISMPGYLPTYTQNYNVQGNIMAGNRPFALRTADQVYTGWGVTPGKAVIQGQVIDRQDGQDVGIGGASVTAQGQSKSYTVTYMDDAGNRRTDRTYGNGKYFVIDVDPGDAVTVTAKKSSWKFPTKVFVTHADGVSQSGIPGTRTLAGVWGAQTMGREPDGQGGTYQWAQTDRITIADNSTGTGGTITLAYTRNENGSVQTGTESQSFKSFMRIADGRYALGMVPQDGGTTSKPAQELAISEDGSMVVLDGAMVVGDRRLDLLVRMEPTKTYGNIDLSGDYFGIGYEHNTTAVNPPDGNGAFMAISNITTFNGAGSYTYLGQANSDGVFWTDDERATARSYTVSTDGSVSIQNGAFLGNLSGNGNVLLGGGSYLAGAAGSWANYIFLKKGDRIYSTADLAGSWAFSGYGDSNGSVRAESGTLLCDAAGICNISGKRLLDNGTMEPFANMVTLAVGADGSFASPGSPVPLGAIGNGGKTFIWNLSFDPQRPQERLIVVAVKAGGMVAGGITNRVWSGTHYDGQTYYGDFVVEDPMHALAAVTLAGPGITSTLNLTYRQDAGAWWIVPQLPLGSLPPTDVYYSLTLRDGSSNPTTVQQRLNGGVTAVATNLAPTGEQTGKLTFTFTGIPGADSYMISLFDGVGNMVWQSSRVLATTIPYEGPPLPMGVFNYIVHSWIGNNCSIAQASFTFSPPVHYQAGDVNHDGKLDLADAIIALRVVSGLDTPVVFPDVDVNFDGGIGLAEALFVMQAMAGLRTSDQQAAQEGIQASLEAYKTLINTKGAAVTPADLLPFFHPAYLDNGFDRNQAAQHDLSDGALQINAFQVNRVLFFDDVRKIATVEVTFSGTLDGNPEMEVFLETLAYDQASGRWLRFGNQKIGEFSAWLGTRRTMTSAGTTDNLNLHLHLWAPQNRVNQVIVSGPGFTGTTFYKDPYPRVEDGIAYDQFTSTLGTELPISRTPALGDTYTFNVTKSDYTMITYAQTLQEVLLGAPEVTAPTGHALADANLGSQLNVSWTLPDASITMENVMLQGQVCNANGCSSVDGVLTSPTSGTITLPAMTDAISASIDVRIHHREQVFTNCRFAFGAAQQTLVTGSNVTLVAYGHPPAGFDFVSGQLLTTGGGDFMITGGDSYSTNAFAYGFLAPGVKIATMGVASGGLGAVTQAPESSLFDEPSSQTFEQGNCYVFQLVNGNYAIIEVKSVNVVYEPSWALTMVFDYKYQTNGSGNF